MCFSKADYEKIMSERASKRSPVVKREIEIGNAIYYAVVLVVVGAAVTMKWWVQFIPWPF